MARHEAKFEAAEEAPLSLNELLTLLGEPKEELERERQHAIACYLSASDGWADAVQRLKGAFAADATGLKERKAD